MKKIGLVYVTYTIPIFLLALLATRTATGYPIATVVSKDQDDDEYYTGGTIVATGATLVDWIVIGTGITA